MGIGESIKRGHDEYRRFFAKLFKTSPEDAKLREQLFTDFQRKLYAHHLGEELTIFPEMIKIPDLRDMTLELEVEHTEREIWRHKLATLYDVMHAHWLKEEATMIPFMPEYFSESELEDFGKTFDETVEKYLKKVGHTTGSYTPSTLTADS
jgi:hemerythrin superfamily protein